MILLLACTAAPVADSASPPRLEVLSPAQGDVLQEGEPVRLEGRATRGGDELPLAEPAWSVQDGDWSAGGNPVQVDDLPVGALRLVFQATVDGHALATGIDIVVEQSAVPVSYEGSMDAAYELYSADYDLTWQGDCPGSLSFVVQPGGALSGTGSCSASGSEVDFSLDGAVSGSEVSGEMTVAGADGAMEFAGTAGDDGTIQAAYDHTWSSPDGWLRIYGTFTAFPVE